MTKEYLVSGELLKAWYPNRSVHWVFRFEDHESWWDWEPFRPTHKVEVYHRDALLCSDLVHLDPPDANNIRFAFCPQSKEDSPEFRLPLLVNQGEDWWTYANPTKEWRDSVVRARPVAVIKDTSQIGWVYFLREGEDGPIKIGWSKNVASRIASLQVANSKPLKLLATFPGPQEEETRIHRMFESTRFSGEWFEASEGLLAFTRSLQ